jgi:hypothetical protein
MLLPPTCHWSGWLVVIVVDTMNAEERDKRDLSRALCIAVAGLSSTGVSKHLFQTKLASSLTGSDQATCVANIAFGRCCGLKNAEVM